MVGEAEVSSVFMFKTKDFVRFDLPDSSYCVSLAGWERGREFAEKKRKPREAKTHSCVCRTDERAHLQG